MSAASRPYKDTGQIEKLSFDLTAPVPFKQMDIHFRDLNVFTGKNGTGKSFIMACCYAFSIIEQAIVLGIKGDPLKEMAQFTFDSCLNNNALDGTMGVEHTSGAYISATFSKGKVMEIITANFEDITNAIPVIYMSSAMRTFNALSAYVRMRNMIAPPGPMKSSEREALIVQMLKGYKLYDVMYVESLLMKLPIKVTPDLSETLSKFEFEPGIIEIGIDNEKGDFYTLTDKGIKKYTTTYGAGNQSILNMVIGGMN